MNPPRPRTHNTPGLCVPTHTAPELTGTALLYKLEDDYAEYRRSCANRLCKSDPAVRASFKERIAEAERKLQSQ